MNGTSCIYAVSPSQEEARNVQRDSMIQLPVSSGCYFSRLSLFVHIYRRRRHSAYGGICRFSPFPLLISTTHCVVFRDLTLLRFFWRMFPQRKNEERTCFHCEARGTEVVLFPCCHLQPMLHHSRSLLAHVTPSRSISTPHC
jgi:hypothetical protein